jgi:hypothetical protein
VNARAGLVLVVALAACQPERKTPVVPDQGGAAVGSTASPVAKSPYDQALADMIAECDPVIESGAADGPARVHERRIDLDRDGTDEAVFNVSCADVSQWKLLTEKNGEAIVLLERIATDTAFDILLGPDGRGLLVIQHDCCCMYELEVHTLDDSRLQQLFAWSSGCAPGCDSGYQAQVESDPAGNLRAIVRPKCGAAGVEQVDLRAWKIAAAPR